MRLQRKRPRQPCIPAKTRTELVSFGRYARSLRLRTRTELASFRHYARSLRLGARPAHQDRRNRSCDLSRPPVAAPTSPPLLRCLAFRSPPLERHWNPKRENRSGASSVFRKTRCRHAEGRSCFGTGAPGQMPRDEASGRALLGECLGTDASGRMPRGKRLGARLRNGLFRTSTSGRGFGADASGRMLRGGRFRTSTFSRLTLHCTRRRG